MRGSRRHIILPERPAELRDNYMRLVPHACEACGELTIRGVLCSECLDRARPHQVDDPYDVLGGEQGPE